MVASDLPQVVPRMALDVVGGGRGVPSGFSQFLWEYMPSSAPLLHGQVDLENPLDGVLEPERQLGLPPGSFHVWTLTCLYNYH